MLMKRRVCPCLRTGDALLKYEYLSELVIDNEAYRNYLAGIDAAKIHNGYFPIDKKTNRLKDPVVGDRSRLNSGAAFWAATTIDAATNGVSL